MARARKTSVLQVEQMFDDGTHPTLQEPLFSGEYGAAAAVPGPTVHPSCPGQMALGETS